MVPESHQGDIEVPDYDGDDNYDYYNQCYKKGLRGVIPPTTLFF